MSRSSDELLSLVEATLELAVEALGPDHLLTMALETAAKTGDDDLLERSITLVSRYPEAVRLKMLAVAK